MLEGTKTCLLERPFTVASSCYIIFIGYTTCLLSTGFIRENKKTTKYIFKISRFHTIN